MRFLRKAAIGTGLVVVIVAVVFLSLIRLNIIHPVKQYNIKDLIVTFPGGPKYLFWRSSDWYAIEVNGSVIFKIMRCEPVVRRYEFITHELIEVSYHTSTKVVPSASLGPAVYVLHAYSNQLVNLLGLMLQNFLQEGFEIGGNSSFIEISGVDSYRFELIMHKVPTQYTWYIVFFQKGDLYSITYSNFDESSPGPHFSDFERFLEEINLAK